MKTFRVRGRRSATEPPRRLPGTPTIAHATSGRRAHPELHGAKRRTYQLVSTYVVEPNFT